MIIFSMLLGNANLLFSSLNFWTAKRGAHEWASLRLKKGEGVKIGTGYEYDGNVFVAWVLQVRRAEVVTKWSTGFGYGHLFYGN
jgi:hypothetical protein